MRNIRIYTTTHCGDCRAAKRFLAEQSIAYEEINILNTEIAFRADEWRIFEHSEQPKSY